MIRSLVAGLSLLILCACTFKDRRDTAERSVVLTVSEANIPGGTSVHNTPNPILRAVTLNLAHGRKDGMNQMLVSDAQTRQNLDDIATFLIGTGADVVALQEADNPSRWSGGFDHVAYLAEKAGFRYYVHANHAQIWVGNYGTAILSKWPITEAMGLTYAGTPPTASKGFTLAQIEWQNPDAPLDKLPIDVVSVHLDFSRKSVRRHQIDELATVLDMRAEQLIIMGDFNSEWLAEEYMVDRTANASALHVFQPASNQLNTYKEKRLDWILLSKGLGFSSYAVEQETLSDHKAVTAEIKLRPTE